MGDRLLLSWRLRGSLGIEPWVIQDMALQEAVSAMISKATVEETLDSPGFYNRMFIVPKSTGGWRPFIDLSPLNQFVPKTKSKWRPRKLSCWPFDKGTGWCL